MTDHLTRSNLWYKLEEHARQTRTPLLAALDALASTTEPPFAGADDLARYRKGRALINAHASKNGFALLNALTPCGEEVPPPRDTCAP
ncbi:MAG: hypothetical protein LBU48_01070 [Coriobacteriales bacterium]|nr:hypothetical protein [Coriobacteriales bacterium]